MSFAIILLVFMIEVWHLFDWFRADKHRLWWCIRGNCSLWFRNIPEVERWIGHSSGALLGAGLQRTRHEWLLVDGQHITTWPQRAHRSRIHAPFRLIMPIYPHATLALPTLQTPDIAVKVCVFNIDVIQPSAVVWLAFVINDTLLKIKGMSKVFWLFQ